MNSRRSLVLVASFGAMAFFWNLGGLALMEPDEGRTAGIAREMYSTGDWLTPRLYGQARFNKPPLTYWMCMLAYRVGGIHEWTARLPSALAAFGTVLLSWVLARRLFSDTTALCAALILATCPLFLAMGRLIDPNMTLTFWVTLAMGSAILWMHDGRPWQRWCFYAALGFSFLTKGPVGLLIVLLPLAGYRWSRKSHFPWRPIWSWGGTALLVLISLPWYVAAASKYPELWEFFIKGELINRFFTQEHNRAKPLLYYAWMIPVAVLPWLPSLCAAILHMIRNFRQDYRACLLGWWCFLPVLMFTLSKSKMPAYILPLLPAYAILMGHQFHEKAVSAVFRRSQVALVLLLALGLPFGLYFIGTHRYGWSTVFAAKDLIWVVAGLFFAALALIEKQRVARSATALSAVFLCVFLFLVGVVQRHESQLGSHSSSRDIAAPLARRVGPLDRVVLWGRYPMALSFYLDRTVCIPQDRFPVQIREEAARSCTYSSEVDFKTQTWFESTQRVFLVTSDRWISELDAKTKSRITEIFRNNRYILVCNQ